MYDFWVIWIIIKAKKQHWAWDTPCYLKWLLGNVQLHSKKPFWSNLHKNKNQVTLLIVDLSKKCQQIQSDQFWSLDGNRISKMSPNLNWSMYLSWTMPPLACQSMSSSIGTKSLLKISFSTSLFIIWFSEQLTGWRNMTGARLEIKHVGGA